MRCVRCGLPSKNYEMSNDGRPAADPYARLDAAYLLGALDADERLAYEAHLAICRRCRASLAEISAIPPLLAGLDESVFAAPPEAAATGVPDTLLPPAASRPTGTSPSPPAHDRSGPACRCLCDCTDRHRPAVEQRRPETGTPGNGRARRHSGQRHHRLAAQIVGHRDPPDLPVSSRHCRAPE